MVRCTRDNDESADAHWVWSSSCMPMHRAMKCRGCGSKALCIRNLGVVVPTWKYSPALLVHAAPYSRQCTHVCMYIHPCRYLLRRSQWPRGMKRGSAAARLLGLWVRIPPGAWMSLLNVVCCQIEVSGSDWSLVQRSPTELGFSLIEGPRNRCYGRTAALKMSFFLLSHFNGATVEWTW
jgi:hypothetical protein